MTNSSLKQVFLSLPNNASEPILYKQFIPRLLERLGFQENEQVPQFSTGMGSQAVDFAVRKNADNDIFLHSLRNPFLITEVKGRDVNLAKGGYTKTVNQIKRYLAPSAVNCQTAKWGIITNADYIQLFRKHGKVVYPITQLISLTPDNIDEKVEQLKQSIQHPYKALTVTVYNNKGGVGKTTTTINLGAYLGIHYNVLVIDFDPNQTDLTQLLEIKKPQYSLYQCLEDYKNYSIEEAISRYSIINKKGEEVGFDVIPADETFMEKTQNHLFSELGIGRLRKILSQLKNIYDYILIDAPPSWGFYSQETVIAADVLLIPTKHNNIASLLNAKEVISKFLKEIGEKRRQAFENSIDMADPTALPIFYNGENMTSPQKREAEENLDKLVKETKREKGIDLHPYFFPKTTKGHHDFRVYEIPYYAYIAKAAFYQKPAVYKYKIAFNYYKSFAKEYFLS